MYKNFKSIIFCSIICYNFEQFAGFIINKPRSEVFSRIRSELTPNQCKLIQEARRRRSQVRYYAQELTLFQKKMDALSQDKLLYNIAVYSQRLLCSRDYQFLQEQLTQNRNITIFVSSDMFEQQKGQLLALMAQGCSVKIVSDSHDKIFLVKTDMNPEMGMFIGDSLQENVACKFMQQCFRAALFSFWEKAKQADDSFAKEILSSSVVSLKKDTDSRTVGLIDGIDRNLTPRENVQLGEWFKNIKNIGKDSDAF